MITLECGRTPEMDNPTPPVQPADHGSARPATATRKSPPGPAAALKWVLFLVILVLLAVLGLGWLHDSGRVLGLPVSIFTVVNFANLWFVA